MGMAEYLSRFSSAAPPETSYYDESLPVAKLEMINDALKPNDQINPRGQKVSNNFEKIRR